MSGCIHLTYQHECIRLPTGIGSRPSDEYRRIQRADFVVFEGTVVKDRRGHTPRVATPDELAACTVVR